MRTVRLCLSLAVPASALLGTACLHAQQMVFPSPFSTLEQPVTTTVSTRFLPGEFRERQLASESNLRIRPGVFWQTTTGLSGSRYEQATQLRNQSARFTTGPQIRMGAFELAMPMQAGQEILVASGDSQWASGTPRMTVQLGPNDSIKFEARASALSENAATHVSKSKKSIAISWRHAFNERFALHSGMERSREVIENSLDTSETAQAFAQLSASLPHHWRLVLGGSLYQVVNHSGASEESSQDRYQSLSLSANRPLLNGWKLSGSLSVRQTQSGDGSTPYTGHTGNLRLSRDF